MYYYKKHLNSMEQLFDLQKIKDFRRELHQNPELSGAEVNTSKQTVKALNQFNPDIIIENIGGCGVVCVFKGKENGPSVLFRCEMDALPIQETNGFDYKSRTKGISHMCGHDGHMAIMIGLAEVFSKSRPERGQVVLLFQPAEENGQGAFSVINDEKFKNINIDYVFALHNLPGFPKGEIILKNGTFSAASKGMIIKLVGKTSHAAEPESGNSPAIAMSNIVKELTLLPNENRFEDFTLVTVVHARLGEIAFGTTPGYSEIMATLRSYSNDDMQILTERAEVIAKENSFRHNLKLEISYTEEFLATNNNNDLVKDIESIAISNSFNYRYLQQSFRWSEDFAHFTQNYPGVLFGLGCGENHPKLHNSDYDFPDEIIEKGVKIFYEIFHKIT